MDWPNERYVRVYVRDSVTWKVIDWQARAVLLFVLRKVDRSGVIDVGEDGIDGLAAIIELPIDVVERGVPQLLKRGTLVRKPTAFVLPNFLEAQEAVQSDAQRARESRARRRAQALGTTAGTTIAGSAHDVTSRDANTETPSRGVTKQAENVTPASPSLASPGQPSCAPGEAKREAASSGTVSTHPLPDGWSPPAGGRWEAEAEAARTRGISDEQLARKLRKFVELAKRKTIRAADWDSQFAEWISTERPERNAAERKPIKPAKKGTRKPRSKRAEKPSREEPDPRITPGRRIPEPVNAPDESTRWFMPTRDLVYEYLGRIVMRHFPADSRQWTDRLCEFSTVASEVGGHSTITVVASRNVTAPNGVAVEARPA